MAISFFTIPRELRNKIYKLAAKHTDGHRKPFSTFELPWAASDLLQNSEVVEEHNKESQAMYKIPKQVDQDRLDKAPAIIEHPLAFACKQTLVEYIEEYCFHVGKNPVIAMVVEPSGKIYGAPRVSAEGQPSIDKLQAEGLVHMLLTKHLPRDARIHLHCELHNAAVYNSTSQSVYYNFASGMTLSHIAKHARELHFDIHSLWSSKQKLINDNLRSCSYGLVGEGAPDRITLRFSDAREEVFEFRAIRKGELAQTSSWTMSDENGYLSDYRSNSRVDLDSHERSNHRRARVEDMKSRMAAKRRQAKD